MAMEVDRLVLRLVADASAYMAVLDGAERRLLFFTSSITTAMAAHATRMAAEFERAAIAFEVMTGSAERGKKLLEDITQLAIATPFHSNELIAAGKQLRAFGFDVEHIMPILENLGEVSAATGTPLERIILAFGQIRASGRLMGQELRQLTNANIPILEHLAKVLNVPMETVRSRIFRGEINFPQVVQAFQLMTQQGGIYAGMMDRVNKETVSGRWEAFTETLMVMSRNFGLAAFEGLRLKDNLRDLTNYITLSKEEQDKAAAGVSEFFDGVRGLAGGVRELAIQIAEWYARNRELVDGFGKFLAAVLAWNLAWRVVQMGVAAFTLLRISILAALSPVRLLVVGLGLLAAHLSYTGITVGETVKAFQDWVGENENAIKSVLELTAVLTASILVYRGLAIAVATFQAVRTVVMALSPELLAVAAAVGVVLLVMREFGAFDGVLKELIVGWENLLKTLQVAGGGIAAALKVGDLKAAWEITTVAMELVWQQMLANMHAAWARFKKNLTTPEANGSYALAEFLLKNVDSGLNNEQLEKVLKNLKEDQEGQKRLNAIAGDAAASSAREQYAAQIDELTKKIEGLAKAANDTAFVMDKLGLANVRNVEKLVGGLDKFGGGPRLAELQASLTGVPKNTDEFQLHLQHVVDRAREAEKAAFQTWAQHRTTRTPEGAAAAAALQTADKNLREAERSQTVFDRRLRLARQRAEQTGEYTAPETPFTNFVADAQRKIAELKAGREAGLKSLFIGTPDAFKNILGGVGDTLIQGMYRGLVGDAADSINVVRQMRAAGKTDEEIQPFVDAAKRATEFLDKFSKALEVAIGKSRLPVEYQVSSEARMLVDKLNESFKHGQTPYDTFTRHSKLLDEAYRGQMSTMTGGAVNAFMAVGGGFAGGLRPGNILNDKMYGVYSAQEYEKLRKAVGDPTDKLSPAMVAGSREAADTVIRSSVQSVGLQEEVLTTLRVSKYLHEQFLDRQDKIARILIEMRDGKASGNGPVHSGAGGEFGLGGTWE